MLLMLASALPDQMMQGRLCSVGQKVMLRADASPKSPPPSFPIAPHTHTS